MVNCYPQEKKLNFGKDSTSSAFNGQNNNQTAKETLKNLKRYKNSNFYNWQENN